MTVQNNQIISVDITEKMRAFVDKNVQSGILNNRTLVGGEGNRSGLLGEIIVAKYLGYQNVIRSSEEDIKNYDLLYKSIKIDVKTKGNSVRPRPDYDCSIPTYQKFQKCDIYIFTRISKDEKFGWIKGWIDKESFWSLAKPKSQHYNNAGRATIGNHMEVLVKNLNSIDTL